MKGIKNFCLKPLDTGCRILDTGYMILVAGYLILDSSAAKLMNKHRLNK